MVTMNFVKSAAEGTRSRSTSPSQKVNGYLDAKKETQVNIPSNTKRGPRKRTLVRRDGKMFKRSKVAQTTKKAPRPRPKPRPKPSNETTATGVHVSAEQALLLELERNALTYQIKINNEGIDAAAKNGRLSKIVQQNSEYKAKADEMEKTLRSDGKKKEARKGKRC